jgi:hypothetical protein
MAGELGGGGGVPGAAFKEEAGSSPGGCFGCYLGSLMRFEKRMTDFFGELGELVATYPRQVSMCRSAAPNGPTSLRPASCLPVRLPATCAHVHGFRRARPSLEPAPATSYPCPAPSHR